MRITLCLAWAFCVFIMGCASFAPPIDKAQEHSKQDQSKEPSKPGQAAPAPEAVATVPHEPQASENPEMAQADEAEEEEEEQQPNPDGEAVTELTPSEIERASLEDVIKFEEPNTHTLYDNSRYDFPVTMNSRVEGWIDYFTGRGRPHMERYLARSSRYIPLMKEILKKEGLPEDLVYLALIESGFNLRARSRARAVGPWQFMKATGKRYGLRVDAWIDERNDPVLSTAAAASYLKDLYLMFESWYLAAAGYNAGENKILRAIQSAKTNNFWHLTETRLIRRETKDYVPKLIAAAIIAKNAEKYGFKEISYLEPMDFETVVVDFPVSLSKIAQLLDADTEALEDLNPQLRRGIVPPNVETYEIRVPVGSRVVVQRAVASLRATLNSSDMPMQYTVRNGDTLGGVANRFRVNSKDLAYVNNLSRREKLSPGSTLIVPKGGRMTAQTVSVRKPSTQPVLESSNSSAAGPATANTHTVKKGDSLWSIAEQYNVTVQDLFHWNSLDDSDIQPGKKLLIHAESGKKIERKRIPLGEPDDKGFIEHVVQSGETLWGIAARYNTSIHKLKKWNNLGKSRIYPGRRLKVQPEGEKA